LYRLYGIIVHIGQGNKHGHYISIIKIKNRWVQFNDVDIEVVDEHMLEKLFGSKNSNYCAYMLFYER
jgi:ubiquitin C-terminal hydrolase